MAMSDSMPSSKEGSYNFTDDRLNTLNCKAYLTKSGLRVFGFCPAGSTQRDFFRISPCFPAKTASQSFELGKDKARWHMNTSLILTGERKKYLARYVEEFSKSGLTVKTIRVAENYMPLEEVSFRTQPYTLHKDSEWEDSPLYDEMTSPFLWVVYQESMRGMILAKVFFWSMPLTDLIAVKEKWLRLKQMLLNGDYRPSYFMSEDSFYYLKIKDKKGGANRKVNDVSVTNLSHWFRKNYVMNIIANSPS